MVEQKGGWPEQQLAAAFPFHLVCDKNLNIVRAGAGVLALCPAVAGAPLAQAFQLKPSLLQMSYAALAEATHVICT